MNYEQIKNEYPKAWEAHMKFMEQHVKDVTKAVMDDMFCYGASMQYKSNIRHLYDFFDEQGLYISVSPNVGYSSWGYCIYNAVGDNWNLEYGIIMNEDTDYGNRKEAEEAAFIKAFEILEDKL